MKSIVKLLILVPAVAVTACSTSSYCEDQQDYERAASVPPLKGDEALSVPESESALRIPPPPPNVVAFGETYKDEDGDDAVRCLDKPPEMAPLPPEPQAVEPVPAAEPTPAPQPAPAAPPPPG